MNKEAFIKYVEMLHRFETLSNKQMSIYSTQDEVKIMNDVRNLIEHDPDLLNLIKKIHATPDSERMNVLNEYFSKKEKEAEKPEKTEEEEIAKTFGIDSSKINHQFLGNGKEIFSFYDSNLGRPVVLENNKQGKSITEYLKEIQEKDERYQTENEESNTNSILRDERNKNDLELDMLDKNEILNNSAKFDDLTKKDKEVLKYLLNNYERLGIKGINIENLIYIDEEGKIHESFINEKQEVVVAEPGDENTSSDEYEEVESNKDSEKDELIEMLDDPQEEKNPEKSNVEEKNNAKVFTKELDTKYGFINNVLYVSIASSVLLLICLVYFLIRYFA